MLEGHRGRCKETQIRAEFLTQDKQTRDKISITHAHWMYKHGLQLSRCISELQVLNVPENWLHEKDDLLQKFRDKPLKHIHSEPEKLVKQLEAKDKTICEWYDARPDPASPNADEQKAKQHIRGVKFDFRRLFDMYWVRLEQVVDDNNADKDLK